MNGLCALAGLSACNQYRCSINCSNNDRVDEGECMSNSVQRMAKAGENIRKLGFCMAAVFAGMLVAFAALVVYVIWYAVANVASVDSFGVVTLLDGGCIVIPSGLCLALVVGISLVVLCGISRNISRGVSPFTKTHVRLICLRLPLLLTPRFRLLVPTDRLILPLVGWSFTSCLIPSLLIFAKALPLMRGRLSARLSVCVSR